MEETLSLQDAELTTLESDRDNYLSRVRSIQRSMDRGLNLDPVTRREALVCELASELDGSLQIGEIAKCGVLMSEIHARQKELQSKLNKQLKVEEKPLKNVQKEIKKIEATIAKTIKLTRDAQALLTNAIGAVRKLKALTF